MRRVAEVAWSVAFREGLALVDEEAEIRAGACSSRPPRWQLEVTGGNLLRRVLVRYRSHVIVHRSVRSEELRCISRGDLELLLGGKVRELLISSAGPVIVVTHSIVVPLDAMRLL